MGDEPDGKKIKMEDQERSSATYSLADNRALIDLVDKVQGEPRDALFRMNLDVRWLRDENIFDKKLRPWLERKIDLFMGGPQSDLVEYVLRRVNAAAQPDNLISDLGRYFDDNADVLIE